jgi:hypothetical protein
MATTQSRQQQTKRCVAAPSQHTNTWPIPQRISCEAVHTHLAGVLVRGHPRSALLLNAGRRGSWLTCSCRCGWLPAAAAAYCVIDGSWFFKMPAEAATCVTRTHASRCSPSSAVSELRPSLLTLRPTPSRLLPPNTRRGGGSGPKQMQIAVTLSELCMRNASATSSSAQRWGSLCSRSLWFCAGGAQGHSKQQQHGVKPRLLERVRQCVR